MSHEWLSETHGSLDDVSTSMTEINVFGVGSAIVAERASALSTTLPPSNKNRVNNIVLSLVWSLLLMLPRAALVLQVIQNY